MNKYLICYWTERNDVCTDLEEVIEAFTLEHALLEFKRTKVYKSISSINQLPNETFMPEFKKTNYKITNVLDKEPDYKK